MVVALLALLQFQWVIGENTVIIPLINHKNMAYLATISIGSPPQKFKTLFSTGTADTWVTSSICSFISCQVHASFKASSSTSYSRSKIPFAVRYASGEMKGDVGWDTLSVGGVTLSRSAFGQINQLDHNAERSYKWLPYDAVVGLAFPGASAIRSAAFAPSPLGAPSPTSDIPEEDLLPFFDKLVGKGHLKTGIFSLYLTRSTTYPPPLVFHKESKRHVEEESGGMLILGGTDPTLYNPPLLWFPVMKPSVFWMLNMSSFHVRSETHHREVALCQTGCRAVFDSAQSLISVPANHYAALKDILQITPNNTCTHLSRLPTLKFEFDGVPFELTARDYVVEVEAPATIGGKACFVGLTPVDIPASMGSVPMWVLGNLFLRRYYTVYDRMMGRMGIASVRQEQ